MKKILPVTRKPDITFNADGRICITSRIARILRLDARSCINVAVNGGEYLLFALRCDVGSHAARVYPVNHGSLYFRANSVTLCRAMLDATHAEHRASLMCGNPIAIDGRTYLPIITRTTL